MAIENEAPLRVAEVPGVILEATGERINFKSAYRLLTKGKRGIRLERKPGLRVLTSREAVLRFLARLASGDRGPAPAVLSRGKQREQRAKNRALVAVGR